MAYEQGRLYDSADDFFRLGGDAVMPLTRAAAIAACEAASARGFTIWRIEGGHWRRPGFEPRLDCIWDGADPPMDRVAAELENATAAEFVRAADPAQDAFILTLAPMALSDAS